MISQSSSKNFVKVFTMLAFATAFACFVLSHILFSAPSIGGREKFYENAANQALLEAEAAEQESESYYRKSIGMERTDRPKDVYERSRHDAELRRKHQTWTSIARIARQNVEEARAKALELQLIRAERSQAVSRVGTFGLVIAILGAIWLGICNFHGGRS